MATGQAVGVSRDNAIRVANDGCRQYMPIIHIWKLQHGFYRRNALLANLTVRNRTAHLVAAAKYLGSGAQWNGKPG
jgi:hypothetical protein